MLSFQPHPFRQVNYRQAFSLLFILLFLISFLISPAPTVSAQENTIGEAQPAVTVATASASQLTGCGGEVLPSSSVEFEAAVIVLVNQFRAQNGVMPLKRVSTLEDAGRYHATDMATEGYFAHNSRDMVGGELVESCTWSNRIQSYYTNWSALAENIAAGYPSPETAVDAWINSEGHRNNLLNGDLWETGVGYVGGFGPYGHYWVQDFGRRAGIYPLVLDYDALTTDSGNLTVHIYGTWQEIRLRTNEGDWSDWVAFQPSMTWQIAGDAGEYTVYAEMRSGGQTATSSDSIYLTQSNATPVVLNTLPEHLSFLYDSEEHVFAPSTHVLYPLQQAPAGYHWRVTVDGNWLNVWPLEGITDDSVEMRAMVASATVEEGNATVIFDLLDSNQAVVDTHTLSVSLEVLSGSATRIYLPTIIR